MSRDVRTKFVFATYWVLNAFNVMRTSTLPGFYPSHDRAQDASELALRAYPWTEIIETWALFALFISGLYFIFIHTRSSFYLLAWTLTALLVDLVLSPTDVGGVSYARLDLELGTLLIITVHWAFLRAVVRGVSPN